MPLPRRWLGEHSTSLTTSLWRSFSSGESFLPLFSFAESCIIFLWALLSLSCCSMLDVYEAALQEQTSGNTTRKRKQAERLLTGNSLEPQQLCQQIWKKLPEPHLLSVRQCHRPRFILRVHRAVSRLLCFYKIMAHRKVKSHLSRWSSQLKEENCSLSINSRVVRQPLRTCTDATHTNKRAQIDTSCDHRVIWPLAFTAYVVVPIPL